MIHRMLQIPVREYIDYAPSYRRTTRAWERALLGLVLFVELGSVVKDITKGQQYVGVVRCEL